MSMRIGTTIVAAALAALALAVVASAQLAPDAYLRTPAYDAGHFPDGYQPQLHTDSSDVVSRYVERSAPTAGIGVGTEMPDGYQPQLSGREAVPVSGSDDGFDWRIFGIASGSALLLAALGGVAVMATRTRRVAHT
jgi:hypothetical protein